MINKSYTISFRVSSTTKDKLNLLALENNTTVSKLISDILENYCVENSNFKKIFKDELIKLVDKIS